MTKNVFMLLRTTFKHDSRVLKEASSLSRAGYRVVIIAVHDRSVPKFEDLEGVIVKRLVLMMSRFRRNKLTSVLKHLEFLLRAGIEVRNADIIHCHDIKPLVAGVVAKYIYMGRKKLVYDAHEHESEVKWLKGFEKQLVAWQERLLIRFADHVITVSGSIARDYRQRYAIKEPSLVLNAPVLSSTEKTDILKSTLGISAGKKVFLYQGALDSGRGIELLLEVFFDAPEQSVVVFMGYGPLATYVESCSATSEAVFYIPAVPPEALLNYTSSADYGLSLIEDVCLSYRFCLPNKIFEYMMVGVPVLCSNLPEMAKVITETGTGVVVDDYDEASIKVAAKKIISMDRGKLVDACHAAKDTYCWERQEEVLLGVYSSL